MKQIRIHGRGGQGVVTAAELIAIAAFNDNKESQAFPSFGVERTGAPIEAFARIDKLPIRTREHVQTPDILIIQDPTLLIAIDVSKGCKNLSGPAAQPLASIVLEIAEDDTIWAVGVLGPDKFHDYFKAFKPELKKFYGGKRKGKKPVKQSAVMLTLNEYTKDIIQY